MSDSAMPGGKSEGNTTCQEIVSMIPAYLQDTLPDRDLERFLLHIHSCKSCYQELETNYMVDKTIRLLQEDGAAEGSFDLTPLLDAELQEKAVHMREKRRTSRFRSIILTATIVLLVLFLLDLTGLFHVTIFFAK